jgi:hypothetical protein
MLRVAEVRGAGPSTPVNLTVMFHSLTNSIVARAAFGKKRKNAAEFMAAIKAGVGLSSARLLHRGPVPDVYYCACHGHRPEAQPPGHPPYGGCWDRPSALAGIDRRLLLGSTVGSCWDRSSALRSARTLNLTQQTEEEENKQ